VRRTCRASSPEIRIFAASPPPRRCAEHGVAPAIVSVVWLAEAAGLPRSVVLSLAPKSVTAGVAMGIAEQLGADPSLTAVSVVLTGIMGAIVVTPLMNRAGITDFRARGFAAGIAAQAPRGRFRSMRWPACSPGLR
jgi:putative effector of murein hydrolase